MTTNMPAHNLREVCDAVCAYIDDESLSSEALMHYIQGPDFPTGGVIFGRKGIRDAYTTGRGHILVRAKFKLETGKTGKETLVFTELPYGVKPKDVLTRISEQMKNGQLEGVSYANDESDKDGIRVIVDLKKGAIVKAVLSRLFVNTQLQTSFGIINRALVGGRPQMLTLRDLVKYFVEHRVEVITRRTKFELRKAEERANILDGLIITLANIDEVVAILKAANDVEAAKDKLKERFLYPAAYEKNKIRVSWHDEAYYAEEALKGRVEAQAQAIVDMRLARITHLEIEKIENELKELGVQIDYLVGLLQDPVKLRAVIKDETRVLSEKYGDARRTEIVAGEVENVNIEDLIKKEEMMISISSLGYIKRVPVSSYRIQARGGKGLQTAKLNEGDYLRQAFVASTHESITFFSTLGRAYWMRVHEVPEASRTGRGDHITTLLQLSPNEEIAATVCLSDADFEKYMLMATDQGTVKKVVVSEFANAKTRGVTAIKLDEGERLVSALLTEGNNDVLLVSRSGKGLRTSEEQVRTMGRSSHGVKGMKLGSDDELIAVLRVNENESVLLITENGYGKRVDTNEYLQHGRATGGQRIYGVNEKTGDLVAAVSVEEGDECMVITSQGMSIKLPVSGIRIMGSSAGGVRVVNISRPDFVVGADRIAKAADEETEAEE
jgi:DNA gyrase subunit A